MFGGVRTLTISRAIVRREVSSNFPKLFAKFSPGVGPRSRRQTLTKKSSLENVRSLSMAAWSKYFPSLAFLGIRRRAAVLCTCCVTNPQKRREDSCTSCTSSQDTSRDSWNHCRRNASSLQLFRVHVQQSSEQAVRRS